MKFVDCWGRRYLNSHYCVSTWKMRTLSVLNKYQLNVPLGGACSAQADCAGYSANNPQAICLQNTCVSL